MVGVSAVVLLQLLVVAVCWRLGAMRSRAVVEWQDCDPVPPTLSCGCDGGGVTFGCLWCGDTRCPEHQDRHDPGSCDGRHFALWEKELQP